MKTREQRKILAKRITQMRTAEGLSQEEAARRTGIAIDQYRSLEIGRADTTDVITLRQITDSYGRPLNDMFIEGPLPPPKHLELVPPFKIEENPGVPTSDEIRKEVEAFRKRIEQKQLQWVLNRKRRGRQMTDGTASDSSERKKGD